MGICLPDSRDIERLIRIESQRLEIEEFIAQMLGAKRRASFSSITRQGVTIQGEITMAELREGRQFDVTVELKTRSGKPAAYQTGTATFVSSLPDVASVTVDPTNELKATVAGLDGAANTPVLITFTADGDPDSDQQRDVIATLDVVVTQGEAFVAELTAGAPTDTP